MTSDSRADLAKWLREEQKDEGLAELRAGVEAELKALADRTKKGYKAANRGVKFEIAFKDADEIRWKTEVLKWALAKIDAATTGKDDEKE